LDSIRCVCASQEGTPSTTRVRAVRKLEITHALRSDLWDSLTTPPSASRSYVSPQEECARDEGEGRCCTIESTRPPWKDRSGGRSKATAVASKPLIGHRSSCPCGRTQNYSLGFTLRHEVKIFVYRFKLGGNDVSVLSHGEHTLHFQRTAPNSTSEEEVPRRTPRRVRVDGPPQR
jgi:hypothetical protein